MIENSTHSSDRTGDGEPLAALEQVQRELDELAHAMNACQSDIDAAARQPGELARQKAELFDRLQQEQQEADARRRQLAELESQLKQKQASLERMARQIESRQHAMQSSSGAVDTNTPEPEPNMASAPTTVERSSRRSPVTLRKPMFTRLVLDLVVLVAVLAAGGGYWWMQHEQMLMHRQIEQIRGALREIHNQALLHGSQGDEPVHASGYPLRIDQSWFTRLPTNVLAPADDPWLEVAGPAQYMQTNPRQIVASTSSAGFWYNPARGIVRARVPMQITDGATVDLYNRLNATSLSSDDVTWTPAGQ